MLAFRRLVDHVRGKVPGRTVLILKTGNEIAVKTSNNKADSPSDGNVCV